MTKLTQKYVQSLFDYRNGKLYWKISLNLSIKIRSKAGSLNQNGYYNVKINGKEYKLHRLIFLYHHGYLPEFLDHIDNNPSNNKIENLREITKSQNMINSKIRLNCSSKYRGVNWNKSNNSWCARIGLNYKRIYLGHFKSETDAAKAYNDAAIKYFKEYAKLNKIGDD